MNFLAHLYLSREDDQLMIGNFIADSVKGGSFKDYEPGIAKGIVLHRAIDEFTDNHPVFLESVRRLRPRYRKYSGVIIDIFYDHFLARDWRDHSPESLHDFTGRVHELLVSQREVMPVRSRQFLQYMIANNIPLPYAEVSGIHKVLTGMSHRARFESRMEHAVTELVKYEADFAREFREFFPEVIRFTEEWKRKFKGLS